MGKYIVDIDGKNIFSDANGSKLSLFVKVNDASAIFCTEIPLTPYTEPDLDAIKQEEYEKGYKTAKVQCNIQAEKDLREVGERHYQKGLSDAWECAKKIVLDKEDGGLDMVAYSETFGFGKGFRTVFKTYTASEAIEKIRQYEQEKEEVKAGDEVENTQTGVRFIVTHMWVNNRGEKGVSGFNRDCSAFSTTIELIRKTGRHFPEIVEALRKMEEWT